MTKLRLGFVLTILAFSAATVQSAPMNASEAQVVERLAEVFATRDPVRLSRAFRAMGDYGQPAADIVESSINAMGYRHLEKGETAEAIAVFRLNTDTFPQSANTWDSLGQALMTKGDHESAIRYYRKSLELDPSNCDAERMIERIAGEQLLSQLSTT